MTPTKTWIVMNDLQESFNQITHFDFLIDKLNEAVNANDQQKIVDISAALTAFYPVYVSNFDDKFKIAWDHVVKNNEM
jgi:hypothetical protein